MKQGPARLKSFASGNFFRAQWMYRRLPKGDAVLEAGRGMSPAFFALLQLIEPQRPVSFGELGQSLAWLHADDLELWLAELCGMGLIAPAIEGVPAETRMTEIAPATEGAQAEARLVQLAAAAPKCGAEARSETKSEREPAETGVDWKRVSLEALYVELLAICVELQIREGEVLAVAA